MKIKICGLTRDEDIEMANRFMPDFIGFVFYINSRRYIAPERASMLKSHLDSKIKAVGVFVNENIYTVKKLCEETAIDVIQLHGNENNEYIECLRTLCGKPIIKSVRVKSTEDIICADKLNCDFLLLDTYTENELGGSGKAFDHKLIPNVSKAYFLAGGINETNISSAARLCSPYAFDVSSGCETNGIKDEEKLEKIISLTHNLI